MKSLHVCNLNYRGSAPFMEVIGAQRMFSRSISQNKLRYVNYYGDGDCKSYSYVKDNYPGITVCKLGVLDMSKNVLVVDKKTCKKLLKDWEGKEN